MRAKGSLHFLVLVLLGLSLFISACDDNNSSEGLTQQQRDAIDTAFNAADNDMDGGLSGDEIVGALESGSSSENEQDRGLVLDGKVAMDELISHHDNFSTDGLSQDELNNIRRDFESSDGDIDSALQQKEILAVMDADRDGTVSKEELLSFHELVASSPSDVPEQFIMPVSEVFSIQGRGTIVTGTIERGEVNIGDDVELVGFTDPIRTTVTAIEMIGSPDIRRADVGDSVGLLVRGVDREQARIGQVLATRGLTSAGQSFTANIMLKTSDEGGRRSPIFTGYSPDFVIRTARVTGTVTFPEGLDILFPGETAENMQVQLKLPLAIEGDLNFELNEGGNVVGSGTITEVTNN